jgi:hypothetical protein
MFVTVRETFYDPAQVSRRRAHLEEFAALRARQPGFVGAVAVDAGAGRVLTLVLWESEERASTALARLEPEARRLLGPPRATPSRVIARGPVLDVARS